MPPPLRQFAAAFGTRAAARRTGIEATAAEIVVVVAAAALFLAGVDGDGLADVARGVGRPVSARTSCALDFYRTLGVPKNGK
jgi:hypothetical protein